MKDADYSVLKNIIDATLALGLGRILENDFWNEGGIAVHGLEVDVLKNAVQRI
ncbi:hypothetical protein [Flavobacterium tegetincola]|uniref:hypothetical protein n=1 Tax=Flavobacterium tegetincola TaxID=150172 RepID=UPI000428EFAD|nr:hypothetical protein [Flavobacterium tegetincola]